MTTKLRSACDRCHQTKVRCSGDIPCQGCLASRSLCLYSVSSPLGRPKGTKNKHHSRSTSGSNSGTSNSHGGSSTTVWHRDGVSKADRPSTPRSSSERVMSKRLSSSFQRSVGELGNKRKNSGSNDRQPSPEAWTTFISEQDQNKDDAAPTIPRSSPRHTSTPSTSLADRNGKNDFDKANAFQGIAPFNDPVDATAQMLSEDNSLNTFPLNLENDWPVFGLSDIAMSNFSSCLNTPGTQSPALWESFTNYDIDNSMSLCPDFILSSPDSRELPERQFETERMKGLNLALDDAASGVDASQIQTMLSSSPNALSRSVSAQETMDMIDADTGEWSQDRLYLNQSDSGRVSGVSTSAPSPKISTVSSLTTSSSPARTPNTTCTCLQQHAELLSNPKLSEILACCNNSGGFDDRVLSIDKALSLARQGMKAWQSLISCPYCPYNDDQEVMLLTFMSIRAVTRYLQRLSPRYGASASGNESTTAGRGSASTRANQRSLPPTPSSSADSNFGDLESLDDSPLTIGSFQVTGDDRVLVLRVLFQNTLQKVKGMLHSLQVIQDKKKQRLVEETSNGGAGIEEYQASSNLFHIQQISHRLVTTIQALESSLQTGK